MANKIKIARQFGEYLDQDAFSKFQELLASDCRYEIGEEVYDTSKSIAGLYEKNMKEGKEKFDELVWGKSNIVQIDDDFFEVYFSDYLKHRGISHNYRCKQRVKINEEYLVEHILHIELPGEREKLEQFYKTVGLAMSKE